MSTSLSSTRSSDRSALPWVSVVVPSFRGEPWIAEALDSMAVQADPGVEILMVDSGPTSAAVDIARTYVDRLTIRIFERPDFTNWHSKTNFAVQVARAAHICWLGVDDVWLPGRAEALRAWIDEAPEIALHFAASEIIGQSGQTLGRWHCPLPSNTPLPPAYILQRLLVQNFVAAPAPLFRRDAWLKCGGLDETLWYTADWDIWLKLATSGFTLYHDRPTVGFRVHAGAQTVTGSKDATEFARQMLNVLERHSTSLASEQTAVVRVARASIEVNVALAAAMSGDRSKLLGAAWRVLALGPAGVRRYLRDSRLAERALPRIRAKLTGKF